MPELAKVYRKYASNPNVLVGEPRRYWRPAVDRAQLNSRSRSPSRQDRSAHVDVKSTTWPALTENGYISTSMSVETLN